MPIENLEEQGLEKVPNLELAQLKFLLTFDKNKNDKALIKRFMDGIQQDSKCER